LLVHSNHLSAIYYNSKKKLFALKKDWQEHRHIIRQLQHTIPLRLIPLKQSRKSKDLENLFSLANVPLKPSFSAKNLNVNFLFNPLTAKAFFKKTDFRLRQF